jgi:hypothetical protein
MVGAIGTSSVQSSALRYIPQSVSDSALNTGAIDTSNIVTSRIRVDNLQNVAILEYISSQGQVVQQYPSPAQIRAFKRAEQLQQAEHQQVAQEAARQHQAAAPVQQAVQASSSTPVQQQPATPASTTAAVPTATFSINAASVVAQSSSLTSSQSVLV